MKEFKQGRKSRAKEVVNMYEEGKNPYQIHMETGITKYTVYKHLVAAGLEPTNPYNSTSKTRDDDQTLISQMSESSQKILRGAWV